MACLLALPVSAVTLVIANKGDDIVVVAESGRAVVLIDPAKGVAAAIPTDRRRSHMLAVPVSLFSRDG